MKSPWEKRGILILTNFPSLFQYNEKIWSFEKNKFSFFEKCSTLSLYVDPSYKNFFLRIPVTIEQSERNVSIDFLPKLARFTNVSHTRLIIQPWPMGARLLARFVYGGPNSVPKLGTHQACTRWSWLIGRLPGRRRLAGGDFQVVIASLPFKPSVAIVQWLIIRCRSHRFFRGKTVVSMFLVLLPLRLAGRSIVHRHRLYRVQPWPSSAMRNRLRSSWSNCGFHRYRFVQDSLNGSSFTFARDVYIDSSFCRWAILKGIVTVFFYRSFGCKCLKI